MRAPMNRAFKVWQVLPPLSLIPALSGRERESRISSQNKTERGDSKMTCEKPVGVRVVFPLPHGEGPSDSCENFPVKRISQ